MIYSKESLETLRERIDLVEVLSSHLRLQRAGSAFKALCPFHEEKTPSFIVQRGDRHYHCFGCGAHGDAIAFLMSYLKMEFVDAVESLAERFQVTLKKAEGSDSLQGPNKAILKQVLERASKFYHFLLLHTEEGHQALHYLYQRGLDLDFIRYFEVGLASRQGDLLTRYLGALSFPELVLEQAGLVSMGRGGRKRDFFFDRITFPIRDGMGAVIGFSARKYREDSSGGKYINTPETLLFKKSHILFGLSYCRQRIAKEKKAIVVEGQVDALRLIHLGFDYTVAGQGTAFGEEHSKELIALGVHCVYLALDGDRAGQEAAVKIGDLFQKKGVEARVVILPEGSDPDLVLREKGPPFFEQLLIESKVYLRFLFNHFSKGCDLSSPSQKNEIVQKIAAQIRGWEQPVMVHESLRQLAEIAHVPESALNVEGMTLPDLFIKKSDSIKTQGVDVHRILEADLLRWLILSGEDNPKVVALARDHIEEHHFYLKTAWHLYRRYMEAKEQNEPCDLLSLGSGLEDGDEPHFLSEIIQRRVNFAKAEEGMQETVRKILMRHWMDEREKIRIEIQNGAHDEAQLMELVKRFDTLKQQPPVIKS